MTDQPRRTLSEHIGQALYDQARRVIATLTDDARGRAVREELAEWYETAHERVTVELRAEKAARGRADRVDTRSTYAIVWLDTAAGPGELCRVRVRDLVDQHGQPIDARATTRDLLAQQQPAPDHVPTEWTTDPGPTP